MPRPYTIRFGPWVPDLQSVGVEMPMQWSDTELAVADCLNVYWQDGAYRCMPSLVSFGPSLGTQILDCFTWYDNTQGKEVLFAPTANGFFTMIDGVWTAVPIQTTQNALGLGITIKLGSPVGLATAMSPTSRSASGTASSYTFPSLSAVIGYGSASSYNWRFGGITGSGSWSIASGQGTATATPEVTGATAGATSSATCYCDIVFSGVTYTVSASLSYTENSLSPLTHSYTTAGSGTETVPSGYTKVVIEVKGGGAGSSSTGYTDAYAAGGGGAGYCRTSMSVTPGGTFNYTVGSHGGTNLNSNGTAGTASTVSSGTISLTTMTANGGNGAFNNGTGGTASGGNQANATGANGVNLGAGGASTAGQYFDTGNTYGHGGNYNGSNVTGGFVSFYYTQS